MATSSGRQVAAPKFFKVIVDPKADNLWIPPEFMKRIGQNLPNRVFLKVPTELVAVEVKLVQSDGKTMLQRGWKEFRERYSIGFGQFLVFEYNGRSEFNVVIFDKSAVEINYPFDVHNNNDTRLAGYKEPKIGERRKVKAENQENTTQTQALQQQSRRWSRRCYERDSKSKLDESSSEECSDDTGSQCSDTVEIQTAVAKETSKAYQIASDVISGHIPKNPFFICLMHQTHVSSRSYLEIPRAFAVETKIARKNAIKLLNEEGKKWRVSIFSERSKNSERFYMTEGWNAFRRENKLYVGNKFRFEFDANSGNLIMKKEIETSKLNVVSSGKRGRERPRKTLINNIPAKNEEPESDDFVELLEEFSTGKRNADYCDHDTIQISDDCTIDVSRNHDDDSTSEECSDDGTVREYLKRLEMQREIVSETSIAKQNAIAFVSDHTPQNPFVICGMHKSYVSRKCSLEFIKNIFITLYRCGFNLCVAFTTINTRSFFLFFFCFLINAARAIVLW